MDPNDPQTAPVAEADPTLSPSVTEGTSSSEVVDKAPESAADAIRREFLDKYGAEEPEETGEPEQEAETEGDEKPEDEATDAAPDDAKSEQKPEEEPLAAETDDGEDDKFRIPDEQFKALPDGVKQRLGHLNARAKKAERELSEISERVAPLEERSSRFEQFETFVRDNGIEAENVTMAFNAMAKMSAGDYQGFIDLVGPWFEQAQMAVGATIAPDLRERVQDGYLTEEDAKELTRARTVATQSEHRVKAVTERDQQRQEAEKAQRTRQQVVQAINEREAHFKSSDPDYALKSQAIASMLEFAIKGGNLPKTAEEAVALVDDAHKRVSASFQRPKSAPRPSIPMPAASSPQSSVREPKSAREAMSMALRSR